MEAVGLKLRWRMKHVQSAKLRGRSSMVVNFWIGEGNSELYYIGTLGT